MAKRAKSTYACTNCGHEEAKWLGRCPDCGEWNTMEERAAAPAAAHSRAARARAAGAAGVSNTAFASGRSGADADREGLAGDSGSARGSGLSAVPGVPVGIGSVEASERGRRSTGIGELDRVLGGGLVEGSTVLVGGEPGIGKSTLMLQMAARMRGARVLYVTGEESAAQLRMRADRLSLGDAEFQVLAESTLESILASIAAGVGGAAYDLVIVDSIQTVFSPEAGAVPGTPNQIKLTTFEISELARAAGSSAFFVAHVTKEGNIAGPKTIEHLVDTVLYFEQNNDDTRFLRSTKNRFGSTDEVGLFTMQATGLIPISDPNSIFLVQRSGALPSGVVVAPVIEGSRVLLVEIQALTVPAKGGVSRVFSDGVDSRRVNRMAAVLEKHIGLVISDQDIYVNVAGGLSIKDVGVELALAMALYGARADRSFPPAAAVSGEVSLAGEVRPVPQMARRARAARELGFSTCIGPARVRQTEERAKPDWSGVDSLDAAIRLAFER